MLAETVAGSEVLFWLLVVVVILGIIVLAKMAIR